MKNNLYTYSFVLRISVTNKEEYEVGQKISETFKNDHPSYVLH